MVEVEPLDHEVVVHVAQRDDRLIPAQQGLRVGVQHQRGASLALDRRLQVHRHLLPLRVLGAGDDCRRCVVPGDHRLQLQRPRLSQRLMPPAPQSGSETGSFLVQHLQRGIIHNRLGGPKVHRVEVHTAGLGIIRCRHAHAEPLPVSADGPGQEAGGALVAGQERQLQNRRLLMVTRQGLRPDGAQVELAGLHRHFLLQADAVPLIALVRSGIGQPHGGLPAVGVWHSLELAFRDAAGVLPPSHGDAPGIQLLKAWVGEQVGLRRTGQRAGDQQYHENHPQQLGHGYSPEPIF